VRIALAECHLATGDWKAMRDFVSKDHWGEMEFLRLAYVSRAWRGLGESMIADSEWNSAVGLADNQLGALNALLQLAGRWGMNGEQEDLLWRILRRFPDAVWAERDLERYYFAAGNTARLHQLYAEGFAVAPKSLELENNLAFTALLMKTNLNEAGQWAAEVYAQQTNNPAVATTYAYALHLQGRDQAALAALRQLDPRALAQSPVALYYGVILNAVGKSNEAAPFLKMTQTNGLLPEERQLLAETIGGK
jgi:tetratricopeptide (TPR) repeat protein